jgi:hypothetical protein
LPSNTKSKRRRWKSYRLSHPFTVTISLS